MLGECFDERAHLRRLRLHIHTQSELDSSLSGLGTDARDESARMRLACDPDEVICREGLGLHSRTLDQLSRDMVGLLADPPQRRAVGERARAFARMSHDIRSVGPRYLELFRDLFELISGTYPSDEASSMAKS